MLIRFVLTAAVLCLFTVTALAQTSNTGNLIGTVSGPDGSIPGATVTVTDAQTHKERTVITSSDGTFNISQLEFGSYTLKVTAQGFKTYVGTDLKIAAGQDYSHNVQLEIGSIQESVTVVAGTDVINSSNAELSNTISPRLVKELPINGRNPLNLLNLLAGVNPTSSSINGQRSSVTNYTRDGLNVQDNFIRLGGFVQDQPTVDDTGEFTAILQNAGAEFSGSQNVQLVTPRGGADFHGSLYEFNRNSKFGANRFFNNFNNVAKPFLNRNQFGGSISGPAPLPRFGEGGPSLYRKKAFFFFNYEGFRLAQQSAASGTTLLPAARTGAFTYTATCTNTGGNNCPAGIVPGQSITINTLTGAGLNLTGANGTAFAAAGGALGIDPVIAARVLSGLPTTANGTTTGVNYLQVVNFNVGNPETRNAVTGRFDVQPNEHHAFNFVYKWNDILDARTDLALGFQTGNPFVDQGGPTRLYVGAWNWTPTSRLSNEVRGGYQRSEPFFFESGVASDYILGGLIVTNPEGTFRDQGRNTDYWNLQDNASYSWGNHSIRFGGQYQKYKIVALNFAGTTPTVSLLGGGGNANYTGLVAGNFNGGINGTDLTRVNALRNFLAGITGSASLTANLVDATTGFRLGAPAIRDLRFTNWSGYIQDQWRVSEKLTLNLGLRYDLYTPLRNPDQVYLEARVSDGQTAQQAALDPNGVYQLVGGNAGSPGAFFKTDKNNFGPTASFAYTPSFEGFLGKIFPGSGKTVLRGGYRISYNNQEYVRSPDNALLNHVGFGATTINATTTLGGTVATTTALRSVLTPRPETTPLFEPVPTGNFTTPTLPTLPRPYSANNTAAIASRFGTVFVIDPHLQVPLTHEYNFGIQREVGWNSVLEVRYVGGKSNELVRSIDFNQINIRDNGFLADFLLAQRNLAFNRQTNPASTNFSTGVGTLSRANLGLTSSNATIVTSLENGTPPDLALTAIQGAQIAAGGPQFLANPNTGVANSLENGGLYNYNALQVELRRRFSGGFSYQVNYTFQKILVDTTQDSQTNVDPYLDNADQKRNYARPDYDRAHTINGNMIFELPFGKGHRWMSSGWGDKIFGGFQFNSIINISSGAPISIRDARGTLNRAARSGLQPASSTLTTDEIKDLIGVFRTPNGIYMVNPSVLQATAVNTAGVRVAIDLFQPLPSGFTGLQVRATAPISTVDPTNPTPFAGQVFFRNRPGSTGNLPMNFINGPLYFNWNAGLFKNIRFGERLRLQIRAEAFNVLNRTNFGPGEASTILDVNGTSFGRITSTFDPRIVQFGARFEF